jgi:CobQ/CobB/MinD/ParA nucleotide binding domain
MACETQPTGTLMEPLDFVQRNRLIIVAGKGGVGKTTVATTLATMAARAGLRVLLVDVEGKTGIDRLVTTPTSTDVTNDGPLGYEPRRLVTLDNGGFLDGRLITSDQALLEWLASKGLKRLASRLAANGTVDVIATAAPGIDDLLVLGRVKSIVNEATYDLVVLDTPASGHAVTFLQSAHGLMQATTVGAIREQAQGVIDLLTDHDRCEVILVTVPEETPVNELIETSDALEDLVGVALGPIVVNQVLPQVSGLSGADFKGVDLSASDRREITAALAGRLARVAAQQAQIDRLRDTLALPQLHLPALAQLGLRRTELDTLVQHCENAVRALEKTAS